MNKTTRTLLVALVSTLSMNLSFSATTSIAGYSTPPLSEIHLISGQSSMDKLNPERMSILVWNIYKGGKPTFKTDFPEIIKDKDLLLIQETDSHPNVQEVYKDIEGFRFDTGVSFTYDKYPNSFSGSAIASKVDPSEVRLFRTKYREPIVSTHKVITSATYPMAGKSEELLAISIHAINFSPMVGFFHQLEQTSEMIKNHKGPIIFGGDFNCRSLTKTNYMRNFFKKLGFKEVTFTNDTRYRSGMTGRIIDYIFVRDLKVLESQVYGELTSSDHMAMRVELSY